MNHKKKTAFIIKAMLFVLMARFCLSHQSASMMIPLSRENLTGESELIILGDVKQIKSEWAEDKKAIFTIATVTVRETVKGKPSQKNLKIMDYLFCAFNNFY